MLTEGRVAVLVLALCVLLPLAALAWLGGWL